MNHNSCPSSLSSNPTHLIWLPEFYFSLMINEFIPAFASADLKFLPLLPSEKALISYPLPPNTCTSDSQESLPKRTAGAGGRKRSNGFLQGHRAVQGEQGQWMSLLQRKKAQACPDLATGEGHNPSSETLLPPTLGSEPPSEGTSMTFAKPTAITTSYAQADPHGQPQRPQ